MGRAGGGQAETRQRPGRDPAEARRCAYGGQARLGGSEWKIELELEQLQGVSERGQAKGKQGED